MDAAHDAGGAARPLCRLAITVARRRLLRSYAQKGLFYWAGRAAETLLEQQPEDEEALFALGACAQSLLQLGDFSGAQRMAQLLQAYRPEDPVVQSVLAAAQQGTRAAWRTYRLVRDNRPGAEAA